jgi:hypothetical protein
MPRLLFACIAFVLAVCVLPARADGFPRVIFPEGHALAADAAGAVSVDVALLQIELRSGLVLSATRGTRLALASAGDAESEGELNVAGGSITIIDLRDNAVLRVPPGNYRLAPISTDAGLAIAALPMAQSGQIAADADVLTPGYRLSDAIMTQQQKYIDSLKIDVKDINKMLASIIRGLVPRRP